MPDTVQMNLPLSWPAADGEEDFFLSSANADVVAWLKRWPDWPNGALILVGPEGSGKSHLCRIFARFHPNARIFEDVDRTCAPEDEERLFHAWNAHARDCGALLMTARTPPAGWPLQLPDLRSRLLATTVASFHAPDDALLRAVMVKQFDDRGLHVTPAALSYLLDRTERTFAGVARLVAALDAASLTWQRHITVPLARHVLADFLSSCPEGEGEDKPKNIHIPGEKSVR